jgi:hypothetical protein
MAKIGKHRRSVVIPEREPEPNWDIPSAPAEPSREPAVQPAREPAHTG